MTFSETQTAVTELSREFETHYNNGNAQELVEAYFASDDYGPVACPPGRQAPIKGQHALIALFSGMFTEAPAIRLETIELTAGDSVAFELGRAHLTLANGTQALGRFTVCWINTDKGWRAKTDFFAEDGWHD